MSKREVSILLTAKNGLQVGLAKAKATLQGFGNAVMGAGKIIGGAFIAAGAAIGAFSAKALSAYAVQQAAVQSLQSSLRAYNDDVSDGSKKIEAYAAAIQNETAVADEALVARAARLRLMGVEVSAMDDALKATVALAAYGVQEETAIKAVAKARQGNYESLNEYIPALKAASSETEKAAILNQYLTAGYAQQKEQLNTVSGRWREFKGRVGDVWEVFGAVIERSAGVQRMLAAASEGVRKFGEAIATWASSKQFEVMQTSIEGIVNALMKGGEARSGAITVVGNYIQAALARGAEIAGGIILKIGPKLGEFIAAGAKAAVGFISEDARKQAIKESGKEGKFFTGLGMSIGIGVSDEDMKQIELRAKQIELEKLNIKLKGEAVDATNAQTAAQAQLMLAQEALIEYAYEYGGAWSSASNTTKAAATEQINIMRDVSSTAAKAAEDRADAEADAVGEIVDVNESAADEIADIWDAAADQFALTEARKVEAAKDAAGEISNAGSLSSGSSAGGTVETTASLRDAKLRAAGIDPSTANGTVLKGVDASNLRNVTQEQILAELKQMNTNQERLLTYG